MIETKSLPTHGLVHTKLCNMFRVSGLGFPMKCSWRSSLLCNNGLVKIPSRYLIDCQNVQLAWTKMFQQVKTIWNNINIQPYIWTQLLFVEPNFHMELLGFRVYSTLIMITQHGFYDWNHNEQWTKMALVIYWASH
jgi:hypothetical protein